MSAWHTKRLEKRIVRLGFVRAEVLQHGRGFSYKAWIGDPSGTWMEGLMGLDYVEAQSELGIIADLLESFKENEERFKIEGGMIHEPT